MTFPDFSNCYFYLEGKKWKIVAVFKNPPTATVIWLLRLFGSLEYVNLTT